MCEQKFVNRWFLLALVAITLILVFMLVGVLSQPVQAQNPVSQETRPKAQLSTPVASERRTEAQTEPRIQKGYITGSVKVDGHIYLRTYETKDTRITKGWVDGEYIHVKERKDE